MGEQVVGVIGATSFVGHALLPALTQKGGRIIAFSRRDIRESEANITWYKYSGDQDMVIDHKRLAAHGGIAAWICVAPIYVLPQYFELMHACGVKRVVALSSTSRFTKSQSLDVKERQMASRLAEVEGQLQNWAKKNGIEWVILRPTLIYGLGLDKNVSEIIRLIQRVGFFPVLGAAQGLRQPVRVEDVARTCIAALENPAAANHAYNISGAETLTYREMVSRIFEALQRRPHLVTMPLGLFNAVVTVLRALPRYRNWNVPMAERMNQDMVFEHTDAARDLGFNPQPFNLTPQDFPH